MMDKIELHEKFRNKALDFLLNQARQKNLPQELKPLIDIANQVKNSKGMSIEYPLQLKTEENINTLIELLGFTIVNQDYFRNTNGKIINRLKMAYLFDIDIDIKDFKIEWIKDDEFIYVYYEKPIRNIF
jgi:hypothetical protein